MSQSLPMQFFLSMPVKGPPPRSSKKLSKSLRLTEMESSVYLRIWTQNSELQDNSSVNSAITYFAKIKHPVLN